MHKLAAASVVRKNMDSVPTIAGVLLAGGRSSRMGVNKAFLDFKGRPLIEHMLDTLIRAGLTHLYISGNVEGFDCIADEHPFTGPAQAICSVLQKIPDYKSYLFIPVDMPFLTPDSLKILISGDEGTYFSGWPLPLYLKHPITSTSYLSVKSLIEENDLHPIEIPTFIKPDFVNVNTPQEWQDALLSL